MRAALSILCASLLLASLACGKYGRPERVVPPNQQALPAVNPAKPEVALDSGLVDAMAKQAAPDADEDAGKNASKSPKP